MSIKPFTLYITDDNGETLDEFFTRIEVSNWMCERAAFILAFNEFDYCGFIPDNSNWCIKPNT